MVKFKEFMNSLSKREEMLFSILVLGWVSFIIVTIFFIPLSTVKDKEVIRQSSIDRIIIYQFPEENNNNLFQIEILSLDGSATFSTRITKDELKKAKLTIDEYFKYDVKEIPKGEVK